MLCVDNSAACVCVCVRRCGRARRKVKDKENIKNYITEPWNIIFAK